MMKSKLINACAAGALLALVGCADGRSVNLGAFPSLNINNATGEVVRSRTDVTVTPILDDGEIIAVDITTLGMTFQLNRKNVQFEGNAVTVEQGGFTFLIVTPFDDVEQIFNAFNEEPSRANFQNHVSAFIFKAETPEGEMMEMDQVTTTAFVESDNDEVPEILDIVAATAGNVTDAEDVGAFAEADEEYEGVRKAYYFGDAAIIEAQEGEEGPVARVLEGRSRLNANFTDGTVDGYITNLRVETLDLDDDDEPRFETSNALGDDNTIAFIRDVIVINETQINGSGFQTDLSLLRGADDEAIGSACNGRCEPGGQIEEGFFSESQVNAQFFGPNGEEIGGTLEYTRTQEFEEFDLRRLEASSSDEGEVEQPEPVEAIGVFSATAEDQF